MGEIIQFKIKYVKVSAVCNECETAWVADIRQHIFNKYIKSNRSCICPFCGSLETGIARHIKK